jgi:hypothetical protein
MSTAHQGFQGQPAVNTEESKEDKAKHRSPSINRDTSTINSTKRSSARSGHKEQRLSLRLAGGTACTTSKRISSYSNDTVMMPSLIRRCVIGAGSSSWARSMSKAQDGLAEPPISVFSFEFRVHLRRCHLALFGALPRPRTLLQQSRFTF